MNIASTLSFAALTLLLSAGQTDWLAPYVVREVTGEPEYTNLRLAR